MKEISSVTMIEEEANGQIPLLTDAEDTFAVVEKVFQDMKLAQQACPNPDWNIRLARLQKLEQLLLTSKEKIEKAISQDFGSRSAFLTDLVDIYPTVNCIRHMIKHAESWSKPRMRLVDMLFLPSRAYIQPQPKGVVGIISPWNYPLILSVGAAAQAIAAGNRVLLKLSEHTPVFSDLLQTLINNNFASDEFYAVTGDVEIASYFSGLPFDHLLFTGSESVGTEVLASAARNLTPVTLELGGKSPAVITEGYPLKEAARKIVRGKLLNAGQTCIAPDYVLLPKGSEESFITQLKEQAQAMYPEGIDSEDYCSIISSIKLDQLLSLLKTASVVGTVHPLFNSDIMNLAKRKLAPHAVTGLTADNPLLREEIFGPILPIVTYDPANISEAVNYIASKPHPLAVYWFDTDEKRMDYVSKNVVCGGVTFNETIYQICQSNLPFGGIGSSGMGQSMGKAGFDTFSHLKPVYVGSKFSKTNLMDPPYSKDFRGLLESLIRGNNPINYFLEKISKKKN